MSRNLTALVIGNAAYTDAVARKSVAGALIVSSAMPVYYLWKRVGRRGVRRATHVYRIRVNALILPS